jgi:poly(3-hydroxyalkanoate) synthetase
MEKIIEKEINPISNIIIFGGYCFGGMTMLSYFSYKAFRNIDQKIKIDRPSG